MSNNEKEIKKNNVNDENSQLMSLDFHESADALTEISRRTALALLERNIEIINDDEPDHTPIITIVTKFMEEAINGLQKHFGVVQNNNDVLSYIQETSNLSNEEVENIDVPIRFNLFGLLDIGVHDMFVTGSEKKGNLAPFAIPGPEVETLIKEFEDRRPEDIDDYDDDEEAYDDDDDDDIE